MPFDVLFIRAASGSALTGTLAAKAVGVGVGFVRVVAAGMMGTLVVAAVGVGVDLIRVASDIGDILIGGIWVGFEFEFLGAGAGVGAGIAAAAGVIGVFVGAVRIGTGVASVTGLAAGVAAGVALGAGLGAGVCGLAIGVLGKTSAKFRRGVIPW